MNDTDMRKLLDRQAILDCVHRFFRGLDRRDESALNSAVFADAVLDYGNLFRGDREALMRALNGPGEEAWSASQHHLTNHLVDFDAGGASAHGESYALVFMRRRDGSGIDMTGARYIDRYERREGVWKIAARVFLWEMDLQAATGVIDGPGRGFAVGIRGPEDLSYMRPLQIKV